MVRLQAAKLPTRLACQLDILAMRMGVFENLRLLVVSTKAEQLMNRTFFPTKAFCGLFAATLLISLCSNGFASTISCEGDDPPIVKMESVTLPDFEVDRPISRISTTTAASAPTNVMEPVDVFEIPVDVEGCTGPEATRSSAK